MKNSFRLALLYGATIIVAAIIIAAIRDKHHQSDNPAPTQAEFEREVYQDSVKFRSLYRDQTAPADYAIPDSAIQK